jgi:hypothetical protein
MSILKTILLAVRAFLLTRAAVTAENLALRQQLAVVSQSVKRPKLRPRDRFFWALLSRLWPNGRSALVIVQPATVIRWHRHGFRLFLPLEVTVPEAGKAGHQAGGPCSDPAYVKREPDLGCSQDPVGAEFAGARPG